MKYRKSRKYCSTKCRVLAHHQRKGDVKTVKLVQKVLKEERSHSKGCVVCDDLELPRKCPKCGRVVDQCYNWISGMCLSCWIGFH